MQTFEEKYFAAIEELFRLHTSVQSVGFTGASYKPGLDSIRAFDEALGKPSAALRCIHVAGTNGKGSVSSILASALSASGLKVGLFTSPHLLDFRERIKILDPEFRMIPKHAVLDFLSRAQTAAPDIFPKLSFFEITTAMAFRWFADEKVDVAVVETGLGGRLDATNIILPALSVITGIGLDHCAILGDTRALIAREKAGIIKPGRPALVWGRDDETDPVFADAALKAGSPLHFATDIIQNVPEDLVNDMDLQGPYQRENLRTALAALKLLGVESWKNAVRNAICNAARIAGLRGRWEKVADGPETICDIGHNPPALEMNFRRLKESGRPVTIVYGVMADKDLDSIAELMPSKARYVLVAPDTPRALPVAALQERLSRLRPDLRTEVAESVTEGVAMARLQAKGEKDALVYVGGSTFVVAEALKNF